jgi:hypothetical protein
MHAFEFAENCKTDEPLTFLILQISGMDWSSQYNVPPSDGVLIKQFMGH